MAAPFGSTAVTLGVPDIVCACAAGAEKGTQRRDTDQEDDSQPRYGDGAKETEVRVSSTRQG